MTDKSAAAIREFADKWGIGYFDDGVNYGYKPTSKKIKECLSDLTSLINENYYPKEFVRWMFQGCPFIIGENGAGNIIAFSVRDGKQFTFDELFNYWEENER